MTLAMSISEQYLVAVLSVPVQGLEGDAAGQGRVLKAILLGRACKEGAVS